MTTQLAFKGMGGHQKGFRGASDEWLTPPEIIKAIGPFDLDPCSPINRPWDTAAKHFTIADDGLAQPWSGRVWLNPPYGPEVEKWLCKLADHGNGIALIFARTDTRWFQQQVFNRASKILFLEGRLKFYRVSGQQAEHNSGAPSVLVAYDRALKSKKDGGMGSALIAYDSGAVMTNTDALKNYCPPGYFV